MNNLITHIDQIVFAIFSFIIMCKSFRAINYCTKETKLLMRIPLVLFMTVSTAVLILIISGFTVHWTFGSLLIAVAFYLISDRRVHSVFIESSHSKQ